MRRHRVLLVDDNDDFLDGLAACIAERREFVVVGRAHSGQEAAERLDELSPDVLLIDMSLPDMSGFELTRRVKSKSPAPFVVLMAFHGSRAARIVAASAGADGLVAEADVPEGLFKVLLGLLQGESNLKLRANAPEPEVSGTEDESDGGAED